MASRERTDTFRHVGLPSNIDVEVDAGGNVGLFMLSAGFGVELSPAHRDELRELLDRAAMPQPVPDTADMRAIPGWPGD